MTGSDFSKHIKIDGKIIGEGQAVYIIAEAGISHFGDEAKAYQLVDMAVEAGADAVKFQIFDIDAMISKELVEWRDRLGSRQLPYKAFERLQSYCKKKNITFFATAHDEPSLDFLESINVPVYKIGSGEVGNWPYFKRIAKIGKPVIFSTGMFQIEQIQQALEVTEDSGNKDIAVLHCVTSYPTPANEVSLENVKLIRDRFNVITGYSDHTAGFHIPLAAVALNARIIEKHITLEFNIPNAQDWKVSCGPDDFGRFVSEVRDIEAAMTLRESGPTSKEKESLKWASKSLVAKYDIKIGTIISEDDLVSKRPGTGISPAELARVIGRKAKIVIKRDEVLKWEDLI